MLKIGDFSKLTQVSIRMLRHYDELDLLKPTRIDPQTGYRYYSAEQLPRLNRILALQDLGFSLKQVAQLLQRDLTPEMMRGMLLQKQAEIEDQVREDQERLVRVAARLSLIERQAGSHDVILKEVEPRWAASVRDKIGSYDTVGSLFNRVFAYLTPMNVFGLAAIIWHDDAHVEEGIDAEALIYLDSPIAESADVRVYQLPAARMASVVHHGAYNTLNGAYDALLHWLDKGGYQIAGPNRELYLHFTTPVRQDDESYVTELQFPVTNL
jgi:DNA-binding transcriptional MerR regulator